LHEPIGWEGRWIEDHLACAANFAIWFAVTLALVFPLRRRPLALLVVGARWLLPLALLAHSVFGELLTADPLN
jgi:hypothetical protein